MREHGAGFSTPLLRLEIEISVRTCCVYVRVCVRKTRLAADARAENFLLCRLPHALELRAQVRAYMLRCAESQHKHFLHNRTTHTQRSAVPCCALYK